MTMIANNGNCARRARSRRRGAGLRGGRHRHPGLSRSRRERIQGLSAGFLAGHRRAHGPARQDLPHRRLRHVHPLAQAGGVRAEQEHRDRHAGGRGGNLGRARQFQGQDPPESALRGSGQVQRLRRLHRGLPGQTCPASSTATWGRARPSSAPTRRPFPTFSAFPKPPGPRPANPPARPA